MTGDGYYVFEVAPEYGSIANVRLSRSEMRKVYEMLATVLDIGMESVNVQVSIPATVELTVERT